MIIDKLFETVAKKGHVCLGLDTSIDYLPENFKTQFDNEEDAIFNFNKKIIEATKDIVACYKVQIAYYEALGLKGLNAYKKTLDYIKSTQNIIISDVKRGDIAKTAEMYAKAHFEGDFETDFITLNPYMGFDTLEPFLPYLKNKEKGIFALLKTSNPGFKDIQFIESNNGKKVYEIIGEKISSIAQNYMGNNEYSSLGAVVGCTSTEEGQNVRNSFKNIFFLIPGYGAQGGAAEEVSVYLKNKNGGVVNSSRGILLGYKKYDNGEKNFDECARKETLKMRDDILNVL